MLLNQSFLSRRNDDRNHLDVREQKGIPRENCRWPVVVGRARFAHWQRLLCFVFMVERRRALARRPILDFDLCLIALFLSPWRKCGKERLDSSAN